MNQTEALNKLASYDHAFIGREQCDEVSKALGIKEPIELQMEVDSRFLFKGLTIYEGGEEGYLDLHAYRKYVKDNWYWLNSVTGKMGQTRYVDETWMAYTGQDEKKAYGLPGVPYTSGIEASDFAMWLCRKLGVFVHGYGGRGFQLRACVEELRTHFGEEKTRGTNA